MKQKIFEVQGGSHAYGLATKDSDLDFRFVYLNTELEDIIGLKSKRDCHVEQDGEKDNVGFELRRFLQLLQKTNTTVVEILFNTNYRFITHPFKRLIFDRRKDFVDTEKLYKSLLGYIQNEKRLMTGQRKGKLGSKRREALNRYGYSPKNYVQIIRLIRCGIDFINNQDFIVDLRKLDTNLQKHLLDIKLKPHILNPKDALDTVNSLELNLKQAFENRDESKDLKFDQEYANQCILNFYYPLLSSYY